MEKANGGVAIFPRQDVLAILPLLPKADGPYTVEQAEGAIRLYQRATPDLLQKAGVGSTGMQDWEKLKQRLLETKTQQEEGERRNREAKEAEAKANLTKEVEDWVAQASDLQASRLEKELTELRQEGEALARKSPEQIDVILQVLAALSQVQPKEKGEPLPELGKLNEVQPKLIPDDLLGWLAGGIIILSFFGLLFGLAFLSSSLTRFKEGALLGGIVFGVVAAGILGNDVVAVLPLLPADNFTGNLQEVEGVLRFLQKVPPDLMRQAGLEEAQIPAWDKLKERLLEAKKQQDERDRKEKESKEAEAKANLTKEIEDWQKQADDFRISRTEKELMDLKQKGEALARQSPEKMEGILQALAVLSQVQPKEKGEPLPDLQKLNDVQPRLVPDDLLGWLAGGVLILSFFGLLFGLAFLSSSLTRFKEGALLGGIVFG